MNELREKYKTIAEILLDCIEKDSGFLFHIYAQKFCKDYQRDFVVYTKQREGDEK